MGRRILSVIGWLCFAGCTAEAASHRPETVQHSGFFVSASDTVKGDGSAKRPWSLTTALTQPASVRAGDTIWLHKGEYRGAFTSLLHGAAGSPVVLRGFPGERVTIDGKLIVQGENAVYRDFEVTNSDTLRFTATPGSDPADYQRRAGIDVHGSDTRFINLIVHDAGGGFGVWSQAINVEIYGCLIYYNGWQGPERGHGHGIYGQNRTGSKRFADNIIFAQFGNGINVFGSDQAFLSGFELDGNVMFDNGILSKEGYATDIFIGGGTTAQQITVTNNLTYRNDGLGTARFGYDPGIVNEDLTLKNNYFVGTTGLVNWKTVTSTGNWFGGAQNVLEINMPPGGTVRQYDWDSNSYTPDLRRRALNSNMPIVVVENDSGRGYELDGWVKQTGNDIAGKTAARATGVHVVVRANQYEQGRAHIIVYNWDHASSVAVTLSTVLRQEDAYEVRSVYDYFGAPVATGRFDGRSIQIPLALPKPSAPVGLVAPNIERSAGEFNAFVVLRVP